LVAPKIVVFAGRFYYKIVTDKKKVDIAFNGIIKRDSKIINKNYNQIIPFLIHIDYTPKMER